MIHGAWIIFRPNDCLMHCSWLKNMGTSLFIPSIANVFSDFSYVAVMAYMHLGQFEIMWMQLVDVHILLDSITKCIIVCTDVVFYYLVT